MEKPTNNEKPTKDANLFKTDARDERMSNPSFMRTEHRIKELKRRQISKDAIDHCNDVAALYAECVKGRTISVPFYCRSQFHDLNECLKEYSKAAMAAAGLNYDDYR